MGIQTRRRSTRNDFAGDASIGAGFMLVAYVGSEGLHSSLPNDERVFAFDDGSGGVSKYLLLPSLRGQANPSFNTSSSNQQQHWCSPDT